VTTAKRLAHVIAAVDPCSPHFGRPYERQHDASEPRAGPFALLWGMTKLRVEVRGNEIVVTLPGTSYAVTYYRAAAFPQQLLTKSHSGGEDEVPR
jgi:hypothetical protein